MSFLRRLLNLGRPDALQRDIEREIAFHMEERVDELVAAGTPRHDAELIARRQFGNRTIQSEDTRSADVLAWADSLGADVRYGLRALRRSPVFTVVAIASLAVGIGFTTSIYSLVDAVILRSLPVPHPEQLVQVTSSDDDTDGYFTNPLWEQVRDRQTAFASVAAFSETRFNLADGGESRYAAAQWVSGDYFRLFGMQPAVGRLLTSADDRRGCAGTVVLGNGFWQSEYAGRRDVVGQTIRLDGKSFEIVGALPAGGFASPDVGREPQLYVPICSDQYLNGEGSSLDRRSNWWLRIIGRRDPSVTLAQVRAQLKQIAPAAYGATVPERWAAEGKLDYAKRTFGARAVEKGVSDLRTRYSKALVVLMGTVAILLLIACGNVANLLLARATARQREVAIRLAVGAGRRRLVRQLLTESAMLAVLGAAAGLLLARWGSTALVALIAPSGEGGLGLDLSLNWRVLAFTASVATATALIFGLVPAIRVTRIDPQAAMKAGGRGVTEGHARGRFTIAKSLVAAQVALSMVLLVGAGLLVGTLRNLRTMDAGFDPSRVLLARVSLARTPWTPEQRVAARRPLLERVRALPGVRSASIADLTPIGGNSWNDQIWMDGFEPKNPRDNLVWFNEVSDRYFATMDIRLLAGRDFDAGDVPTSPKVAIVDELTARKYFGAQSALGKQFRTKSGDSFNEPFTIVGVVESAKYKNLRETSSLTVYQAASQMATVGTFMSLQLRAEGDPLSFIPAVRQLLTEVHPSVGITFTPMARQVASSLARERMLALLSTGFGAVALALAMLGLYGVMSYTVARRRNEIGVRIALGASAARVLRMVLGDTGRVVAAGLVIGGAGAVAAGRLVESFLFGVRPAEPMVFALAVIALAVVALGAAMIPAWRASRVNPVEALRED